MVYHLKTFSLASLTILAIVCSTSTVASIYKCEHEGLTTYQSAPCDVNNESENKVAGIITSTKSESVKNCENAFNTCLTSIKASLYQEGRNYCSARLDLCIATSEKKDPETLKSHSNKVNLLANIYNASSSAITAQSQTDKLQSQQDSINSDYNTRIKRKAEKQYKACFKKLSSSIKYINGASNSLKRACENDKMPASCAFGLSKLAKQQCGTRKNQYLSKWIR